MSIDTTDETPAQRRLREARERAAERESNPEDAIRLPRAGETAHCLVSGTLVYSGDVIAGGHVLRRGQQFIITDAMLQASRNIRGEWRGVALVNHPELQRYYHRGQVLFAPGPTPDDLDPWVYGDAAWADARERARLDAHAQRTEEERRAALAEVHRRYGPTQPQTSFTRYVSASERAWEDDERARRAAALAEVPHLGSSSTGGGE